MHMCMFLDLYLIKYHTTAPGLATGDYIKVMQTHCFNLTFTNVTINLAFPCLLFCHLAGQCIENSIIKLLSQQEWRKQFYIGQANQQE